MGKDVEPQAFTREDRTAFRLQLSKSMEACRRMVAESFLETKSGLAGFEVELNLVGEHGEPALRNAEILRDLDDPSVQPELARFNLELNVEPRRLDERGLVGFENDVRRRLERIRAVGRRFDALPVTIGILPTLTTEHVTADTLSTNARYALLNEQIFLARGEDLRIEIEGTDRLAMTADSVAPEAACTSTQLHLQLGPDAFAAYWNASQAIAGVQVAVGANAPFLFGRELWQESRITLFEQAIDTRPRELQAQGVRPRVWFGERWIDSALDLFEENVRYFAPLLPVCDTEDPLEVLERGAIPQLPEFRLHNGTIYRWNRPVYDVVEGRPHLRVENRVLPSGPTLIDTLANAAFYFGLCRCLAEDEEPVWERLSFGAAAENFELGARYGMGARLYWPDLGKVEVPELVLRRLLPKAYEGLDRWGVDPAQRDRLLGVIERRCATRRNGAAWQVQVFHDLYDNGPYDRSDALSAMTLRYLANMAADVPVHSWPLR